MWSPQQDQALKTVSAWLKDMHGPQVFRLFGYAGTGKTFLATHLAKDVQSTVFAAFTGKAALVLRRKGCAGASTIHSLIYTPKSDGTNEPEFVLNQDSPVKQAKLVVIDEVSMVGETLALDLLSFGKRVLVLGDPAQLPPVKDAGYFTECQPDIMLTEIHRQAKDNPIIRLSMDVREGRSLQKGDYGATRVVGRGEISRSEVLAADQVLVGRNKTRHLYNQRIRELRGFSAKSLFPVPDERIICLRNDHQKGLLNGGMWCVKKCSRSGKWLRINIQSEDVAGKSLKVDVLTDFFRGTAQELPWQQRKRSSEFDFGHAVTVHKAQGSQWNSVVLFNESEAFREDSRRWLYTGITRAAERITIVGS